jgi:ribosomal protein L11 methyltransferase
MSKLRTWIEVTVPCSIGSKEAVGNFLLEQGSCGLEEGGEYVKAYFSQEDFHPRTENDLNVFLNSLREMGHSIGHPDVHEIQEQDWSRAWRAYFKPLRVTPRIVVKPPWEEWSSRAGDIVIDITPRMAFGTGTHETTQLCIQLLETHLESSQSVLDVGTGSGILAIAAAKLGAPMVLALDIDEEAVKNAKENIVQNQAEDRVSVFTGSIDILELQQFDCILANIDKQTLIHLLPKLEPYMKSGGKLILSGILTSEMSDMEIFLHSNAFRILEAREEGEWVGLVARGER